MSKAKNYYVDNVKFQQALEEYRKKCVQAEADGKEIPRIPMYIGDCFMKIATHLAFRPNFANYTFIEEMIMDGVETCCKYMHNYDPDKFDNPHAYFTTTIWRAFIQRINKEKTYLYKKHVATQIAEINNNLSATQDHDTNDYHRNEQGEWSQEQMERFMDDFETKRKRRRKKKE